jgi:hypothetical protein
MQLSILSLERTFELLKRADLEAQIVDYMPLEMTSELQAHLTQINRVEELSDAYHLRAGQQDLLVAYLLRIRHRCPSPAES